MMAEESRAAGEDTQELRFSLDLPVHNDWCTIDLLRSSVQACLQAVCAAADVCDAVAMVTGELLENALKYGATALREPGLVRLLVSGGVQRMCVVVQNPVLPGDAGVRELLRTIEWIQGFDSPESAYRARLLEIAASESAEAIEGKLGLVRVAYEGNCTLSASIDDNILSVTATMLL